MAITGPEWLKQAERIAGTFRAITAGERGAKHSVYVILLHDPARNGRWGLYVGQTSRDPDWRFDQHKAGYKASGAVKRFGVRLLPDFVAHLNPMKRWESLELEAALADAFRDAGIEWIEGGHLYYCEWHAQTRHQSSCEAAALGWNGAAASSSFKTL